MFNRKRFKQLAWKFFAGCIATMVFLVVLLQSSWVSLYLRDKIVETLEAKSHLEVSIIQVRLRPLQLAVQIEGVKITSPDAAPLDQPILLLPKLIIGFRLPFFGDPIRKIRLDDPILHLDTNLLKNFPKSTVNSESKTKEFWTEIPKVQIVNGQFSIFQDDNYLSLHDFNVNLKDNTGIIWMEETSVLSVKGQNILLSPFHWNDIIVQTKNIHFRDLSLESSVGHVMGNLKLQNSEWMGALTSSIDLDELVKTPKIEMMGKVDLSILPR